MSGVHLSLPSGSDAFKCKSGAPVVRAGKDQSRRRDRKEFELQNKGQQVRDFLIFFISCLCFFWEEKRRSNWNRWRWKGQRLARGHFSCCLGPSWSNLHIKSLSLSLEDLMCVWFLFNPWRAVNCTMQRSGIMWGREEIELQLQKMFSLSISLLPVRLMPPDY